MTPGYASPEQVRGEAVTTAECKSIGKPAMKTLIRRLRKLKLKRSHRARRNAELRRDETAKAVVEGRDGRTGAKPEGNDNLTW
jgi:hypothetical protein